MSKKAEENARKWKDLLDGANIKTVGELRALFGDRKIVKFDELKMLIPDPSVDSKRLTMQQLLKMTNDQHIMIPEPGDDPPRANR